MRSLRSIVAVCAGAAAVIVLNRALTGPLNDAIAAKYVPHFDAATRPPLSDPGKWLAAWLLFYGLLMLAGGFLTALLAPSRRVQHALILAVLVDVLAVVGWDVQLTGDVWAYGSNIGPAPVNLARGIAATAAGAALGGLLAARLMAHHPRVTPGP